MPRRFPLQTLHTLAAERLDAATRHLAQLQQQWQAAQEKLAQLQGFQEEYRQRLGQTVAGGMDVGRMRDYHAFLAKIEIAIRQQRAEVERRFQEWERGRQAWLEERRKLKTYDVLKDRHLRSEHTREARLEQREQDEHARRTQGGAIDPPAPRRKE